ncbi:hypothetical protein [Bdellovibrio sp. HCB209]|uniref:hypothetical protein n=1 Tax=Bdellovibrio sp. HCB209 TaxID=3394354 RepID=UPI0039B685C6
MEQQTEKRKLLIIKSHPQSLGPVEGFLKNRDWEIKSTHNLKEAMIHLVQHQPQFVMVSIDHPNKKVRNLPKVLSQAFPVCVIAFAEHSTPASVKVLNDCSSGYAIYHPITGPAVERMVNKYHKDQSANPGALGAQRTWESGNGPGSGVIAIRGGEGGPDTANASTQNFLANLMGALESNSTSGTFVPMTPGNVDGSSAIVQPGMAGYIPPSQQDPNSNGFAAGGTSGLNGTDATGGPIGGFDPSFLGTGNSHQNGNHNSMTGGFGSNDPQFTGGSAGNQHNPHGNGHNGFNPNNPFGQNGEGNFQPSKSGSSNPYEPNYESYGDSRSNPTRGKKNDPSWGPSEISRRDNLKEIADEVANDPGSLILKGTREAMEKACVITDKKHEVRHATNVACILVESGRFSGYLVAAMAQHITIDIQFIDKIRTRLFKFLSDNGENLENNGTMPIRIKQVPFTAWAVDHAEFLRKSVHEGNEVAMAFFPRADLKADLKDSPDEEMAAVQIHEMKSDVVVDFNVYVHLPRNNRYVLYTPEGGVFLNEQKNRLMNQGITHLHILRMELVNLDKYRAQNYLNDKIDEFEAQQDAVLKKTKAS